MFSPVVLAAAGLVYVVWVAVYRLYLSPLAKIPGPKLAALTTWYCAYHDIVRGGQYMWEVEAMHRAYGPVVRIMPGVVHVNDPAFVERLYTSSPAVRRERAWTVLNLFATKGATLPTRDHDLHRRRRGVISRFFSQQNVRRLVPYINDTLADLLARLDGWAEREEVVALAVPFRAATKDMIQSYAFGDGGQRCLRMPDCNAPLFDVIKMERVSHAAVHMHVLLQCFASLPGPVVKALSPALGNFVHFVEDLARTIEDIRHSTDEPERRTIFHEILHSDLAEHEKSTARMTDEAMVLAVAGTDTTAATLVALAYHVLGDEAVFSRLRAELDEAILDPSLPPDPARLDRLPFLNALIEETLRLYPGATHRQDRVAPDEDLVYTYPGPDGRVLVIPRGTPVGMSAMLVNRSPQWHRDPDVFRPDRFIDEPGTRRRSLTFSKGARQCLGINLAYQELQTLTAGLFRVYGRYDPARGARQGQPTLELFETGIEDVRTHADFVSPGLRPGSKGVQVRVRRG